MNRYAPVTKRSHDLFVTPGDSTDYIQRCLDLLPSDGSLVFRSGSHHLSKPLRWAGKALNIIGQEDSVLVQKFNRPEPMIQASSASGTRIRNLSLHGKDSVGTYVTYRSSLNTVSSNMAAIRVLDSSNVNIRRISVYDKMTGVVLDSCTDSEISLATMHGFGKDIAGEKIPSNWHSGVVIRQGSDIYVDRLSCSNFGNAVVTGRYRPDIQTTQLPVNIFITESRISACFDNAIYFSSVDRANVVGTQVNGCNSSGVRIQGENVSVLGCILIRCGNGVTIQGRETYPVKDERFSGGYAVLKDLEILDSRARGIAFDDKANSLVFTRSNVVSDCLIRGGCTAGGIVGTAEFSSIVDCEISHTSGSAIRLLGTGNSPRISGWSMKRILIRDPLRTPITLSGVTKSHLCDIDIFSKRSAGPMASLTKVSNSSMIRISDSKNRHIRAHDCSLNVFRTKSRVLHSWS